MIIQHNGTATVMETEGTPSAFKIQATAIAFKVLSSQLYTNKIKAVIRELVCNAIDSHVAAGNPDPVIVVLPTKFQPTFRVEDNGVGMSDEAVTDLYCTYFSSDKQKSNALIGGFGLGSKSPFAYTNGFSITSVYDGVRRIYDAHLNEQGMPEVVKMMEEPTQDRNGVVISVPVEPQDNGEFAAEAAKVLEFLADKVQVKGRTLDIVKPTYIYKTDEWAYRGNSYGDHCRFIQGGIAYKVQLQDLDLKDSGKPYDIWCDSGELELAVSREALSLTEQTKRLCLAKIAKVDEAVHTYLKSLVAQCQTLQEAKDKAYELMRRFSDLKLEYTHFYGKYAKFNLTSMSLFINQFDYDSFTIAATYGKCKEYDPIFINSGHYAYINALRDAEGTNSKPSLIQELPYRPGSVFIENDLGKAIMAKVLKFYVANIVRGNYAFVFNKREDDKITDERYRKELNTFAELAGIKLVKASDVVAVYKASQPKKAVVKVKKERAFAFVFSPFQHKWVDMFSPVCSSDPNLLPGVKYYVPLSYGIPTNAAWNDTPGKFNEAINAILYSKYFIPEKSTIYGFPESKCPKSDNPNWVNLEELVKEKIEQNADSLKERLSAKSSFSQQRYNSIWANHEFQELLEATESLNSTNKAIKNFLELYKKYRALAQSTSEYLWTAVSTFRNLHIEPINFAQEYLALIKKVYPMMGLINIEMLRRSDIPTIIAYFELCEK